MQSESSVSAPVNEPCESVEQLIKEQIGNWSKFVESYKPSDIRPLRKLLGKNVLFWGLSTSQIIHQPVIARLLQLKRKSSSNSTRASSKGGNEFSYEEAVRLWLDADEASFGHCLQGVAWAHALPDLVPHIPEDLWFQLLVSLMQHELANDEVDAARSFIYQVEIPMAVTYGLPHLAACKKLRKLARAKFEELLNHLLDGQGTPHARNLTNIQLLLASCVRSLTIDAESKKGKIPKGSRLHFDWLTQQTIRWARPDGSSMLVSERDSPYFDDLILAATDLSKDESDLIAFKALRGKRISAADRKLLPETSQTSEWSEAATMRTTWDAKSPWLATTYHDRKFSIELGVAGQIILNGSSKLSVFVDGEKQEQDSDWLDVCWESDSDVDYLELECTLEGGWRVQRQILLARDDLFLFFADALTGPRQAVVQYQHTFPLCEAITVEQADETTEAAILGEKRLGHVLPIALPEWKSVQGDGLLRTDPFRLELTASASAIYAPMFVCLDQERRSKPLTWRQLTVAENLLPVSPEEAVAYRVQIGKKQWVIYKSLSKIGNRTFLGLNLISDFYVARFQSDGESELLIDVEPDVET